MGQPAETPPPVPLLSYNTPRGPQGPARPLALAGTTATVLFAAAFVGATTNAVNGALSPTYFIRIMGWEGVADVWRASIAQGVFEGLIIGTLVSLVFTLTVGLVTRATCTYRLALRYLLKMLLGVYGCWVIGGLIAMGLLILGPDFYRSTFIGVPNDDLGEALRYAWVGGSIWGAEIGGLLSLIVTLLIFHSDWKRAARANPGG